MGNTTLALTLLILILPGCLMVREGKVKPPVPWPPQTQQGKKSIGLSVSGVANPRGAHQMPRTEAIETAREQAVKAYLESGLFSSVVTTDDPTDLRADIALIEDGSDGMGVWAYLSALTFTMIPGYVSEDLIVNTSFSDRSKKVIDTIEKKEQMGFWIQFFLLFTMPFTDSSSETSQATYYDIHRAIIQDAHNRGVF
jgi:hypothetical protein